MVAGDEKIDVSSNGFFMRPTLLIDTDNNMRINREEVLVPLPVLSGQMITIMHSDFK